MAQIDTDSLRSSLLKQREIIEEQLIMLTKFEKLSNNIPALQSIGNNGKYSNMTTIKACEMVFANNSNEYTVKNIITILKKEGVKLSDKYVHATISSNLNRLVKKTILTKQRKGKEMFFKKDQKAEG